MTNQTSNTEPAEPQDLPTQPGPDAFTEAAIDQENSLLERVVLQAQVQHLVNRCVMLNAENRRLSAAADASSEA